MNEQELIKTARKKVKDKKEFYTHLYVFCMVAAVLFLVNYFATPDRWWFYFPLIGWAMAVVGHYLNVFGLPSFKDEIWEAQQFEIEVDKLKKEQGVEHQEEETLEISDDKLELSKLKEKRPNYNTDDYV